MEQRLRMFNAIFFALMIIVNALGEFLPLGIGSTGAISAKYPNLFTPAPITFSIWGLIYLMVAAFVLFQMNIGNSNSTSAAVVDAIGMWFIISCIMNMGWMISWHYNVIWLSVIFMAGLLISLIRIVSSFSSITNPNIITMVSSAGFKIYLGWICAATIANVSVLLVKYNWNGFGLSEQLWTMIALALGAAVAILFIIVSRNYISALAIIWAYCGILVKHISQSGYAGKYPVVITATVVCISAIVAIGILKLFFPKHA